MFTSKVQTDGSKLL